MRSMSDAELGEWARLVASTSRLRLLTLLAQGADLPQGKLALALGCTKSALANNLRLVQQQKLVHRRALKGNAYWSIAPDAPQSPHLAMLNRWLCKVLASVEGDEKTESLHAILFMGATIFTCPRRIRILRELHRAGGSMPNTELRERLHMHPFTLNHHLDKLQRRGIVAVEGAVCRLALSFKSPLHRELYQMIMFAEAPDAPAECPMHSPPARDSASVLTIDPSAIPATTDLPHHFPDG